MRLNFFLVSGILIFFLIIFLSGCVESVPKITPSMSATAWKSTQPFAFLNYDFSGSTFLVEIYNNSLSDIYLESVSIGGNVFEVNKQIRFFDSINIEIPMSSNCISGEKYFFSRESIIIKFEPGKIEVEPRMELINEDGVQKNVMDIAGICK